MENKHAKDGVVSAIKNAPRTDETVMDFLIRWVNNCFGVFRQKSEFVISESDIEAAVEHLRLPYSITAQMPQEWSRKRFLDTLTSALRENPNPKHALPVDPCVWILIQPFGVDLVRK